MSTQIAVRLPDELVEFVDELVRSGAVSSRAEVVTKALERERRLALAMKDAAILASKGGYPDLDGLVSWTSAYPNTID